MKVILLADIKGVGKKDDIINASDGHARNYLIPRNLAVEATPNHMNQLERKKRALEKSRMENLEDAMEFAKKIEKLQIKIFVKSGENGKLFGSVTNKEIADEIEKVSGISIDKKKIVLDEPIKAIGVRKITIKVHQDVTAKLNIHIEELQ